MKGFKGFVKDPNAILDYSLDWGPWLDGDTISTSTWVVESPLVIEAGSENFNDTVTTLYISGGDVNQRYTVTNTITTAAGRRDDRSLELRIRNR